MRELNHRWRRGIAMEGPGHLPEVGAGDHARGAVDAKVTLVEYGDFQSPDCRAAARVVSTLLGETDGNVRFVFRHFPLADAHQHAFAAAQGLEAAGAQERFWELHDKLFADDRVPDAQRVRGAARSLGLDVDRYDADVRAGRHLGRIYDDFAGGARGGVNGTPTFFVNGTRHDDDCDADTLGRAVREAASAP